MTENQYGQVPKFMLIGVEKLTKHPLNEEIRFITTDDFERLKKSVLEEKNTGYFNGRPCLVSEKGDVMEIMAGNNRFEAVKALGFTEIPCMVFTGLNAAEELRWLIKDNGQYAQFEHNAMSSFFDAPQLLDMGVHVPVVFSDAELETTDFGGTDAEKTEEDDFEPAEIESIKTDIVIGDLFEIGGHRLLCGDSTDKPAVERLMGGKKADMVFTDPPYGISFQSNRRPKETTFDMLKNDDSFVTKWIAYLADYSKGFVFVWTTWKVLTDWVKFCGPIGELSNMIVWDKGGGGIGDLKKTFSTDYEIALVYHRGAELIGSRIGSVWGIGKDGGTKYLHPTQKPVALAIMAIESVLGKGLICLDLFLGSGTTMVASEKTGRACFGMELDPKYCEVIVKRMIAAFPTLSVSRNGKDETAVWLDKTTQTK